MADHRLRLVGGSDFRQSKPQAQVQPAQGQGGWPLPPALLAALQNADPKTLRRAQNALMIALDIELVPVQAR